MYLPTSVQGSIMIIIIKENVQKLGIEIYYIGTQVHDVNCGL